MKYGVDGMDTINQLKPLLLIKRKVFIPPTPYFIKSSLFRTLQLQTIIKFEECLDWVGVFYEKQMSVMTSEPTCLLSFLTSSLRCIINSLRSAAERIRT